MFTSEQTPTTVGWISSLTWRQVYLPEPQSYAPLETITITAALARDLI